tara:strand:+ start:6837 stop:9629 length:2793 start_codon:yes stop_codon:yes gene_type:complete
MQDFLYETAQRVINEQQEELENAVIVLPNRRAALFLKKHFGTLIKGAIWAPKIISAEEFLEELSDVSVLDNVQLQFEFFEIYKKVVPLEEQNSFDQFMQWGTTLLQDFSEIDRYLIDPKKIFSYVNEARAIEVWNLELTDITEVQMNYLKFWKQMETLYNSLRKYLEEQQLAYPGLSYRIAAERLSEEKIVNTPYNHIYFAGFNALTAAEQLIMERFVLAKKATMLFDADAYYLNDQLHEAGLFMRQLINKPHFKHGFETVGNHFKKNKNITIYSVPKNVGQAKLAGELLQKANKINEYRDTAVVLADENLLLPVLQSLPDEVEKVNITMGYPINNSPIYTFFERFIHLHQKAELYKEQRNTVAFYYKDVFNLLDHPFLASISSSITAASIQACKTKVEHSNAVNLTISDLVEYFPILENISITKDEGLSVDFLLKKALQLIEIAKNNYSDTDKSANEKLDIEYLFHLAKIFNQITDLQKRFNSIDKLSTFYSIFKQLCKQATIPFFGEPLSGLQLLGVLETRTIDFKNLILLTVNEGVLPSGKSQNSFIPYDIKNQFGLPTHKEKDAIYAYHFYRLIQRAENISLIYNSSSDKMGGGERSRFIEQLVNELPSYNPDVSIVETLVQTPLPQSNSNEISIERNDLIDQKIKDHLKRGISPSAINAFITCPLDYYYRYVIGLKEPEEIEESIAANSFGSIIHESLEEAYKDQVGKTIVKEQLTDLEKAAKEACRNLFTEKYGSTTLNVGKNHLIYSVAQSYIHEFFKQEKELLKAHTLRIISLEEKLKEPFTFNFKGNEITANLKGIADRIDEVDGNLRVIDYKTGLVDNTKLKLSKDFDEIDLSKFSQAIQLLIYGYIYAKKHQLNELPESGILSFRKIKDGLSSLLFDQKFPMENHLEAVEELLSRIFTDMLEKNSFEHNSDAKYCKFCS